MWSSTQIQYDVLAPLTCQNPIGLYPVVQYKQYAVKKSKFMLLQQTKNSNLHNK